MKYTLLFFIILFNSCGFECQSYLDNEIRPLSIEGVIISKEKAETGCFGNIILRSRTKIDTLYSLCYCVMSSDQDLWKYVEPGDSLYKASKSLLVEVYHGDKLKNFEYPCCSQ